MDRLVAQGKVEEDARELDAGRHGSLSAYLSRGYNCRWLQGAGIAACLDRPVEDEAEIDLSLLIGTARPQRDAGQFGWSAKTQCEARP